ncbi:MAG TPA: choice-of-anchor D domain-containing protein [Terriglobales bacterium]|nr:choice-of-anchor D domain-containing protein [Terriglobales bacterium]
MKLRQLGATIVVGTAAIALLTRLHSQTAPMELQVSATKIDFGEAAVGSESPPHPLTLTNGTKSNFAIEQIITSGIDFSQKNDCGQTLASGAQCTIQVFFKPVIPGPRIGNLGVTGSDPASPHFIALNGAGK